MSKRTVVDCDRCGEQIEKPFELCLHVGRSMGPAGSSEDDYENFDLCIPCAQRSVGALRKHIGLTFEAAQWWANDIKNARKRP